MYTFMDAPTITVPLCLHELLVEQTEQHIATYNLCSLASKVITNYSRPEVVKNVAKEYFFCTWIQSQIVGHFRTVINMYVMWPHEIPLSQPFA